MEGVFAIESGEMIEGKLPKGKVKLVAAWIEIHRESLLADWQLAVSGQRIFSHRTTQMNPRVTSVKPLDNYRLELLFANQERKVFDVKPYLTTGIFQELQDESLFKGIRAFNGSIVWPNDLDLDPDTLYLESRAVD